MKRSEIQTAIEKAREALGAFRISLPPFAGWSREDYMGMGRSIDSLKRCMLGWDVTDFGNDDFRNTGAVLFTLRNGVAGTATGTGTPYAEKLIILEEKQRLPIHMHKTKTEDIISRAGAGFEIRLWNTGSDGKPDREKDVRVFCDGVERMVRAGECITIENGQSITLTPYMYHTFWGGKGGIAVVGEVSSTNDDKTDNYFAEPVRRFSQIEEDEDRKYVLCNEYDTLA